LDGIIVATFSSIADSANYILAQRFRNPLTLIYSAFATKVKPIAAKREFVLIKALVKDEAILLSCGLLANLIISVIAYFYSELILGDAYEGVNLLMFFGTLTAIPVGAILISTNILSNFGAEKFVAQGNVVYLISLFSIIGIFSYHFGSLGAVISSFLISLTYALCCFITVIKQDKKNRSKLPHIVAFRRGAN
jgi:O-antigen/teichoic acid export membrane protein